METILPVSEYRLKPYEASERILSTLHHKPCSKCKDKITSVILVWAKSEHFNRCGEVAPLLGGVAKMTSAW